KRIQSWIAGFGDRLAEVDIDGESAYVLREHLEQLAATPATTAIRLLPRYDQWVLGPGTADAHVVPRARRSLVSRGVDLVIVGGVVSGTWSLTDDQVVAAWFAEAGQPSQQALAEAVSRLAAILDRPLEARIEIA
ncbi:MAG: DNA glycosylase AlkZ-like family protein, partial [Gaiellaceae bacterium]